MPSRLVVLTHWTAHTVMLRIKADAYGRISRGSNHASIQSMLLFKNMILHQHHESTQCSAYWHACTCTCTLQRAASIQIMPLCHGALRKSASIQVMLLYRSCFYTRHYSTSIYPMHTHTLTLILPFMYTMILNA